MKYVDSKKLGEVLSLKERTIRKLAGTKELPAIRVGRVWRFDLDAVKRSLEKQTTI